MRREEWLVPAPGMGTDGHVVAYGHWGRPVLVFPCEAGGAHDAEQHGIIHARRLATHRRPTTPAIPVVIGRVLRSTGVADGREHRVGFSPGSR